MIYFAYVVFAFNAAVALLFFVALLLGCEKPRSTFIALLVALADSSALAFLLFGQ